MSVSTVVRRVTWLPVVSYAQIPPLIENCGNLIKQPTKSGSCILEASILFKGASLVTKALVDPDSEQNLLGLEMARQLGI